jgi:hypothetical protein
MKTRTTWRSGPIVQDIAARLDDLAKSQTRHELARELGVATSTIKTLLEKQVPKDMSPKQQRAWARALTRIARYVGAEPRAWVEGYGFQWSDAFAANTARTLDEAAPPEADDIVLRSIRSRATARFGGTVRIAYSTLFPFASDRGDEENFYTLLARRLIGTINPDWTMADPRQFLDIDQTIGTLLDRPDECHAVFGLFDTIARRQQDISFIPIAGLRMPLGMVAPTNDVQWGDVVGGRCWPLVIRGEAGDHFVRGECGYDSDACEFVSSFNYQEIGATLRRMVSERGGGARPVFVADEETCRLVITFGSGNGSQLRIVELARGSFRPSYAICIAVRSDAGKWVRLLREAQAELFASVPEVVADFYARLLYRKARRKVMYGLRLDDFPQASLQFRTVLIDRLCDLILQGSSGWIEDAESRKNETYGQLRSLLPDPWIAQIDRVFERTPEANHEQLAVQDTLRRAEDLIVRMHDLLEQMEGRTVSVQT